MLSIATHTYAKNAPHSCKRVKAAKNPLIVSFMKEAVIDEEADL